MIEVDPERNMLSMLLWFMSQMMDNNISFVSSEINEKEKWIKVSLTDLKVISYLFSKEYTGFGIGCIKFLLDLASKNQLLSIERVPQKGYEYLAIDTFKFVYEGEVQWPTKESEDKIMKKLF